MTSRRSTRAIEGMRLKKKIVDAARPPQMKPNQNLNAQTRKVLAKHYRAKYGVK